jgi:hypothetical protein
MKLLGLATLLYVLTVPAEMRFNLVWSCWPGAKCSVQTRAIESNRSFKGNRLFTPPTPFSTLSLSLSLSSPKQLRVTPKAALANPQPGNQRHTTKANFSCIAVPQHPTTHVATPVKSSANYSRLRFVNGSTASYSLPPAASSTLKAPLSIAICASSPAVVERSAPCWAATSTAAPVCTIKTSCGGVL